MYIHLLFIFCFSLTILKAQPLRVKSADDALFLEHPVAAKETWYSLGRLYHVSAKQLAAYNHAKLSNDLKIGVIVQIPLSDTNFLQEENPEPGDFIIPIVHTVQEKEGLFRISQQYRKVDQALLRQWNGLATDATRLGMDMIIGFLRVRKESSLSARAWKGYPANGIVINPATVLDSLRILKVTDSTLAAKKSSAPIAKVSENTFSGRADTAALKTVGAAGVSVVKTSMADKDSISPAVRENTSIYTGSSNQVAPRRDTTGLPQIPVDFEGVYKEIFEKQIKDRATQKVSGSASFFKSISGWKDGKFYLLMQGATPGTIVQIKSVANGRIVYAKVLGEIPPGKGNEGLLARISSAAVAQLQMPEAKFDVVLEW